MKVVVFLFSVCIIFSTSTAQDDATVTTTSTITTTVNIFDGNSKAEKEHSTTKSSSSDSAAKSQKPFTVAKSGKSKTIKTEVVDVDCIDNNRMDEPHKLFAKNGKGGSGKGGGMSSSTKSGKSSAVFAKAGKSKGNKKSSAAFAKAGKSKGNKSSKKRCETGDDEVGEIGENYNGETDSDALPPPAQPADNTSPCNTNAGVPPEDFNLCISIDSSGSVCNGGRSIQCLQCSPSFWCQDSGFDKATCCNNFSKVKEFTRTVVRTLEDESSADKMYSVVQFGKEVFTEGELSSGEDTIITLNDMSYVGVYTDHSSAIEACQRTFEPVPDRKNFILLVTDGVSTWPQGNAKESAIAAATLAKDSGTIIIPIFISASNDADSLGFMRKLSSDGTVDYVKDFESLSGLQDSLVELVSCS